MGQLDILSAELPAQEAIYMALAPNLMLQKQVLMLPFMRLEQNQEKFQVTLRDRTCPGSEEYGITLYPHNYPDDGTALSSRRT